MLIELQTSQYFNWLWHNNDDVFFSEFLFSAIYQFLHQCVNIFNHKTRGKRIELRNHYSTWQIYLLGTWKSLRKNKTSPQMRIIIMSNVLWLQPIKNERKKFERTVKNKIVLQNRCITTRLQVMITNRWWAHNRISEVFCSNSHFLRKMVLSSYKHIKLLLILVSILR